MTDIPYSPIPGGFDSSMVPAARAIMEALEDVRCPLVVLCLAVQTCKSLSLELQIAAWTVRDPGPTMLVLPQAAEAADEMTMRLRPLLEAIPPVAQLIPTGADKDLAKKTSILFRNGQSLWVLGSHPRNLQRRSLRRVLIDEAWQFDPGRIGEAIARTTAFGYLGKVVLASQGSDPDHDFARYWDSTDQRDWTFACPECGFRQPYQWDQIKFESVKDDRGDYDFDAIAETVGLECVSCHHVFDDTDETRRDLNRTGEFVAMNPSAPSGKVGFHLNALATMSWAALVEEYLTAKVASWRGDFGPLQQFHMKRLAGFFGEAADEDFQIEIEGSGYQTNDLAEWQDDPDEWDEGAISMIGGSLRIVRGPASTRGQAFQRLRFFTVDVQRDHFWGVIRSYTPDGRSRLIWAGKILSWEEIEHLGRKFEIHRNLTFIDCGDQPFADVYPNAARFGFTCLRGDKRLTFGHREGRKKGALVQRYYSPVRWVTLGDGTSKKIRVHHFSALNCRDVLARLMKMPDRWQLPDNLAKLCPEYEEQLSSQRRVKNRNGNWIWKTVGKRGEHLADCETMQIVAGLMVKILGAEVAVEDVDTEEAA